MKRLWLLVSILLTFALTNTVVAAGGPTDLIKSRVGQVIKILQDPAMKGPANDQKRTDAIWKVIQPVFDDARMTRLVMSRHWRKLDGSQKTELIDLFGHLLKKSYVTKLDSYAGEKIVYSEERITDDKAVVDSAIIHRDEKIPLVYKMIQKDGVWKIYDVVIDNVSLVTNYRQQFGVVIRKDGYDGLVKRLRDKRNKK